MPDISISLDSMYSKMYFTQTYNSVNDGLHNLSPGSILGQGVWWPWPRREEFGHEAGPDQGNISQN